MSLFPGCKPPEGLSEIRTAGDICELQSAQLRHAGDELAAAVENILENLRGIAGNVAGMSRTTREAIGITSDAGSSFGSEMERGLSPVASALSRYAAGNRQLTAAISSVLGTVGEMATYVKDIESIEIQMRLIALNAIVKASRIDGNGAPLGVLAEEIHQLSFVTHQHVDIISVSLKSIMTTAEKLAAGIETEAESGEAELDRMMRKLKDLLESLRRLNEDSVSALMRADVAGRNLADEIEAFAAEIAVHDDFAKKIREVMSKLDAMVARSRALAPVEGDLDRAERLSALEARYTMDSERSIHQAVAAAATSGIPQAIVLPEHETGAGNDGETKGIVDDDLGDNVELF
jgi:methyl-accepting chemotaxis protein